MVEQNISQIFRTQQVFGAHVGFFKQRNKGVIGGSEDRIGTFGFQGINQTSLLHSGSEGCEATVFNGHVDDILSILCHHRSSQDQEQND
jgi:hypothetical protein